LKELSETEDASGFESEIREIEFLVNDPAEIPSIRNLIKKLKETIKEEKDGKAKILADAKEIAQKGFSYKAIEEGMNRFVWDLKYPKPKTLKGSIMSLSRVDGTPAAPGVYKARLKAGDSKLTQEFSVKKDPRWEATQADLEAQFELGTQVANLLAEAHTMIGRIRGVREQAKEISSRAVDAGFNNKIDEACEAFSKKLTEAEDELIQRSSETGQDPINYPPKIDNQIAYLLGIVNTQDAKPTQGCYERFEDLKEGLAQIKAQLDGIWETELTAFNRLLDEEGVGRIILGNEKNSD